MKTSEFLHEYKIIKQQLDILVRDVSFGKQVSDNIRDIIPNGWKLEPDNYRGDIRITPINENMTAEQFDIALSKLARVLRIEPYKDINETNLSATFHLYRERHLGTKHGSNGHVRIEINLKNTEACEVIYKRKMQKVAVLTGYCKALNDKKYLINKN